MKKTIKISEKTHKALTEYKKANKYDTFDNIIMFLLIQEKNTILRF